MENKILVFGNGFMGNRIKEELDCDLSSRKILTLKDAEEEIKKFSPKTIINCIGHIGRNVDDCELDKDKSLMSNVFVPVILAEAALRHNVKLVHISSGCIFHYDYKKDKPINEDKAPDFFDLFYSRTKIYSEAALKSLLSKYPILILRIRVPLDNKPYSKNLLTKLLGFKQIINLPNSITYIPDFISALKHLLRVKATGIYNVVNKESLVYSDLLDVYKKYVPSISYKVVDYNKLNLVRTNLILDTRKLEKSGFKVRKVSQILHECVREYIKNEKK